jgi:uncharacterized membrane protein YkvA (DUF1232 family)
MTRELTADAGLREIVADFPHLLKLVYRLLQENRVSIFDKAVLLGIVLYVLNPLDLMPDAIPLLGQVDDAYLLVLGLLRILNRADPEVLNRNWTGRQGVVPLVKSLTRAVTFYMPYKARTILLGKAWAK